MNVNVLCINYKYLPPFITQNNMDDWEENVADWEMGNWDDTEEWEDDIKMANNHVLNYNILSLEELETKRILINSQFSKQYDMNIDDIDLIIRVIGHDKQHKWNSLIDDQSDFRNKNNILNPSYWNDDTCHPEPMKCPLCLGEYDFKSGYQSICGHWHCKDCCRDYLTSEIQSESGGIFVGCMALVEQNQSFEKCNIRIPYSHVKQLVTSNIFDVYAKNITLHFVQYTNSLTACPGVNCDKYIEYTEGGHQEITCECNSVFCFTCKLTPHFMVPCDLAG